MRNTGSILCIGLLAATLGPFGAASAQTPTALEQGDRVRVDLALPETQAVEGTFQGVRGDSVLILLRAGSEVVQIPEDHIQRICVHLGERRLTWMGFGIGGASGALFGGAIGFALGDDPPFLSSDGDPFPFSAEDKAAIGAVFGGLVVGGIGALVGHGMWTGRWEEVGVPPVRPSLQVAPSGRLGLGLTIPVGR